MAEQYAQGYTQWINRQHLFNNHRIQKAKVYFPVLKIGGYKKICVEHHMVSGETFILLQNEGKSAPQSTLTLREHEWRELCGLDTMINDFFTAVREKKSDKEVLQVFHDDGLLQTTHNGGLSTTIPIIENDLFLIFTWKFEDSIASITLKRLLGSDKDKVFLTDINAKYLFNELASRVDSAIDMWANMHEEGKKFMDHLTA